MERRDGVDCRFLAINTGPSISISSTYILFLAKLQKGKPEKNEFALI